MPPLQFLDGNDYHCCAIVAEMKQINSNIRVGGLPNGPDLLTWKAQILSTFGSINLVNGFYTTNGPRHQNKKSVWTCHFIACWPSGPLGNCRGLDLELNALIGIEIAEKANWVEGFLFRSKCCFLWSGISIFVKMLPFFSHGLWFFLSKWWFFGSP